MRERLNAVETPVYPCFTLNLKDFTAIGRVHPTLLTWTFIVADNSARDPYVFRRDDLQFNGLRAAPHDDLENHFIYSIINDRDNLSAPIPMTGASLFAMGGLVWHHDSLLSQMGHWEASERLRKVSGKLRLGSLAQRLQRALTEDISGATELIGCITDKAQRKFQRKTKESLSLICRLNMLWTSEAISNPRFGPVEISIVGGRSSIVSLRLAFQTWER